MVLGFMGGRFDTISASNDPRATKKDIYECYLD